MTYIFWTGGFDSTFRMCQLSREDTVVQPIYVIDPNRKSVKREIAAMAKITAMLSARHCKAEIRPLIMHKLDDFVIDPRITEAYREIRKKVKLGSQYEWLAQVSKWYPSVEIGIENALNASNPCFEAVNELGVMAFDGDIGYVDQARSADALNTVMSNFRFPIIKYTAADMVNLYHEWGYEDIINEIWFCHTPAHGKPCGVCRPCQQKIEDRMLFLVDGTAIRRYNIFHFMEKTVGELIAARFARILKYF